MSSQEKPTFAFILSLVGGILIVLSGLVLLLLMTLGWSWMGGMMAGPWMMMGPWMMGGFGFLYSLMLGFSLAGLVAGIFVIIGAILGIAGGVLALSWKTASKA